MNHWILKTEPTVFSVADLERAPRRTSMWDGVRNYQARNMLRDDFRRADRALLHYSGCDTPGIAALVRVTRGGYADPTAFRRASPHYDATSTRANPRWYAVDVQLERALARIITLAELKQHANGALKGLILLNRGNRLSVMPMSEAHFAFILALE
jgi:predicted RNA-binding protein with PUA-like domain